MKRFPAHLPVALTFILLSAASARANQLTFLIDAGTIAGWDLFGSSCYSNLSNCGIYGVGLIGVSGQTVTSSSISIPTLGTNDQWTSKSGTIGAYGGVGIEAHDVSGGKIAFITNDSTISTANKTYKTANPTGGPGMGVAPVSSSSGSAVTHAGIISATTDLQIVLNFADYVAPTQTLSLEFAGLSFKWDGSQNKTLDDRISVTLTAATVTGNPVSATPEPSSLILILGGIALVGLSRMRCRARPEARA